jgi:ABC-type multidrug transport system fused ATPase/permease subunit
MEELNNQQVTYDSFMKENVIARKAEASAIGLSVEELTKQLLLQKQANALGAEQGQSLQERYGELMKTVEGQKLVKQQLTEQEQIDLRRASIQDKFQSAVERLQDTFGRMLTQELGQLLDRFADFVSDGKRMNEFAEKIRGLFSSLASVLQKLPDYLNMAAVAAKAFLSVSVASAVANVVGGLAKGGPAGVVAGILAGIGTYAWLSSLGSGSPSSPPSVGAGGESGTSMTTPLNPVTATAQQNTQAAVPANQQAPVFTFHHVTQLDGQVLTKYNAKETMKTQGLGNNKR